ncbi:Hypothetical protein CAP_7763 [Chondromyces apiculatus DSM 436]|uniref:Uncharacterized protein n=2 Tax=Chondromyces apiculatus TaxID=51 RepID=A0A017SYW6_9BACT|nr:Hypothetical protein CAP_7763 [Chondromyces apiculatus DSM 436]
MVPQSSVTLAAPAVGTTEQACARYEALLVALHREMRAGRGEGPCAEDLRGEMATLWYELDEEQATLLDDLSEDLYLIEGKRAVVSFSEGETVSGMGQQLERAFKAGESRRVLTLIRKLPSIEAPTAFVMGRSWGKLGLQQATACFYEFANAFGSGNPAQYTRYEEVHDVEGAPSANGRELKPQIDESEGRGAKMNNAHSSTV